MGRYRPPRRRGSKYITPEGEQALRDIYGKRRLREIDSRVRFLNKRLDELEVVERAPDDISRVFFGAWVTLEDEDGEEKRWRIVGPDEFDLAAGKLSMDSPMARSLIGKGLDDEIVVHSPSGERTYYVTQISYSA